MGHLAHPRHPTGGVLVEEDGAACDRHQLGAQPEQPSRRCLGRHDGTAGVARADVDHTALARGQGLGDGADVVVGNVHDAALERLHAAAVDHARDDLGPAHLELVALAAHRLDEDGQLQLATSRHLHHVGRAGVGDADGDVAEHLALKPRP